jgi:hypothetical protein
MIDVKMALEERVLESVEKDSCDRGQGAVSDCCEHGNEPSGSMKC